MQYRRHFIFIIVTLTFLGIYAYYAYIGQKDIVNLKPEQIFGQYGGSDKKYGISLKHCKTPLSRLYSEGYLRNYQDRPELMKEMEGVCGSSPDFSKLENGTVFLTDLKLRNCCAAEITRPWKDPQDNYTLNNNSCVQIDPPGYSLDVSELEFMAVICDNPDLPNSQVYNFHANVPVHGRLRPKMEYWKNQARDRPFSIFVLVIDSTSRAEVFRSLTNTVDHLLRSMNFVDFRGHHPLGEPTQANVMPMLMGIQRSTFRREFFEFKEKKFWDSCPFVWHPFNQLNYVTGYFEDFPEVGTFNYHGQLGFEEQPTTLYTRPLMAAHASVTNYSEENYKEYCFGQRNVIEFMLDYHFETLQLLSKVPTFQVTWPCWIQHNFGGSLSFLDKTYLEFFRKISENEEILENTLLMVLSDHGFYNTKLDRYPNSYQSLLERRNVPLFVRLPNRMQRDYPEIQENLKWNSHLLTSHYDIYQTLVEIAKMAGETEPLTNLTTYGSSLLKKIPETRTCEEARIPKTMCLCNIPSRTESRSMFEKGKLIDRNAFDTFV